MAQYFGKCPEINACHKEVTGCSVAKVVKMEIFKAGLHPCSHE